MRRQYEVQFSRVERSYIIITVEADTKEEAVKLARKEAKEREDDFCDNTPGRIHVEQVWQR